MPRLTQQDFSNLEKFATANDRVGYWTYFSKCGDHYATLALGVATNETLAGYVANNFFQKTVNAAGVNLSENDLYNKVVSSLMNADLIAREEAFKGNVSDGGLHLSVKDIAEYHERVFKNATDGKVGLEGWTPGLPVT